MMFCVLVDDGRKTECEFVGLFRQNVWVVTRLIITERFAGRAKLLPLLSAFVVFEQLENAELQTVGGGRG